MSNCDLDSNFLQGEKFKSLDLDFWGMIEDAEIPLAQLKLLKLRGHKGLDRAPRVDLSEVDRVYDELSGKKKVEEEYTSQAPSPIEALPTIRFEAMIQYDAESESEVMADTVMSLVEGLLLVGNREIDGQEERDVPQPISNNLEIDQREQLEDLAVWRRKLMSAVIP